MTSIRVVHFARSAMGLFKSRRKSFRSRKNVASGTSNENIVDTARDPSDARNTSLSLSSSPVFQRWTRRHHSKDLSYASASLPSSLLDIPTIDPPPEPHLFLTHVDASGIAFYCRCKDPNQHPIHSIIEDEGRKSEVRRILELSGYERVDMVEGQNDLLKQQRIECDENNRDSACSP